MPEFTYRARSGKGELVKGKIEGENTAAVARELEIQGYLPVNIQRSSGNSKQFSLSLGKQIKSDDLILFTKQFYTIVKTGIPLIRGLQTLRDQAENAKLQEIISSLLKDVQEGGTLGDAMKKHPSIFSTVYYNTVKAGEASGRLEEMLSKLADFLEYEQKVKEEIKSATRYPMIVITVMIMAFFILVTWVIPKFTIMFTRFEMELPLPTRILIAANLYIREYWYLIFAITLGFVVGLRYMLQTDRGIRIWDQAKLRIPVIGEIIFRSIISRFARIFATLSSSGVPILETMDILRVTVGNTVVADRLKRIQKQVMKGTGISVPMRKEKGFPPLLVQMISIGEETGALEDMLMEVSQHYETEIDFKLRRLTSAIEPILIIGLGAMMLLMALAVFMPMWNMAGVVRQ
jgi:type IV pilus assembly protein PilC